MAELNVLSTERTTFSCTVVDGRVARVVAAGRVGRAARGDRGAVREHDAAVDGRGERHVDRERLVAAGSEAGRVGAGDVWPEAEQAADEPEVWKVRPPLSVSVTVKPPVLSDGPPLCTVSV